jgi:hypothetical protein
MPNAWEGFQQRDLSMDMPIDLANGEDKSGSLRDSLPYSEYYLSQ